MYIIVKIALESVWMRWELWVAIPIPSWNTCPYRCDPTWKWCPRPGGEGCKALGSPFGPIFWDNSSLLSQNAWVLVGFSIWEWQPARDPVVTTVAIPLERLLLAETCPILAQSAQFSYPLPEIYMTTPYFFCSKFPAGFMVFPADSPAKHSFLQALAYISPYFLSKELEYVSSELRNHPEIRKLHPYGPYGPYWHRAEPVRCRPATSKRRAKKEEEDMSQLHLSQEARNYLMHADYETWHIWAFLRWSYNYDMTMN